MQLLSKLTLMFLFIPALSFAQQRVTALELVSSETNKTLQILKEGDVLNLATLPTTGFSIRAITNPDEVGSVRFGINSNSKIQVENRFPYTLTGDDSKLYPHPWHPSVGNYYIKATPYSKRSATGTIGDPLGLNIKIVNQAPPKLIGFNLINADTDQIIDKLIPGQVLNLATLPSRNFTIQAVTAPDEIGSVIFALDGNSKYALENSLPYSISGDKNGDYAPLSIGLGSHSLSATPYSESRGEGIKGDSLSVNFSIIDQPPVQVVSLSLVDTDTDLPIRELKNGDVVNLRDLPSRNFTIIANTYPSTIGSVNFALDGTSNYQLENVLPYSINGDNHGDFSPLVLSLGAHSIVATPFSEARGDGEKGPSLEVNFTLVDEWVTESMKFTPIYDQNQYLNGILYRPQSAEKDWSIAKSSEGNIYRFEVREGEGRVSGADNTENNPRERAELYRSGYPMGTEVWASYSFMVESGEKFTDVASNIGQWHPGISISPALAIQRYYNDKIRIISRSGKSGSVQSVTRYKGPMERGQWQHIVQQVVFNAYGKGMLKIWLNGNLIIDHSNISIGYTDSEGTYWKFGIYRASTPVPESVRYANMEVGKESLFKRVGNPLPIKP
jgi:hypothetical protein